MSLTPTNESLVVLSILLILSLVTAFVTLRLLEGSAYFQHRGVRLGGSAAMFAVTFMLLNQFLPDIRDGIIRESQAAPQSIAINDKNSGGSEFLFALSPTDQITTLTDLRRLSRNDFVVDEEIEIAVARPRDGSWQTGVFEEGVETIDLSQIPLLQLSLSAMKTISGVSNGDFKVFGVRSAKTVEIVIQKDSEIDGISVSFNPFEKKEFIRQIFKAQVDVRSNLMGGAEFGARQSDQMIDMIVATVHPKLKKSYEGLVDKSFPRTARIRNGVFIYSIPIESLNSAGSENLISEFSKRDSNLDKALNFFSLNTVFGIIASNLEVDQRRQIMSFNGTVELSDVKVDDSEADVKIHHIGFIAAGNTRAVFVNLVFLSSGQEDISTILILQDFLRSLRFTV